MGGLFSYFVSVFFFHNKPLGEDATDHVFSPKIEKDQARQTIKKQVTKTTLSSNKSRKGDRQMNRGWYGGSGGLIWIWERGDG